MPALVVVGSLNMDFVVSVDRLPVAGETVLGREFPDDPRRQRGQPGLRGRQTGSRRSGGRAIIGRVGYDVFADHLKASLAAAGVDVSAVHASKSQPTGVALIWVDKQGQNSIVVASGANYALAAADVESMRKIFRGASLALFQLETPLDTVAAGLALAREEGLRTMLDPAPAQALSAELLAHVDILTPNENEALVLLGRPPARVSRGGSSGAGAGFAQTRTAQRGAEAGRRRLLLLRRCGVLPHARVSGGSARFDGGGRYFQCGAGRGFGGRAADGASGPVCQCGSRDFRDAHGRASFCAHAGRS